MAHFLQFHRFNGGTWSNSGFLAGLGALILLDFLLPYWPLFETCGSTHLHYPSLFTFIILPAWGDAQSRSIGGSQFYLPSSRCGRSNKKPFIFSLVSFSRPRFLPQVSGSLAPAAPAACSCSPRGLHSPPGFGPNWRL